MRRMDLLFLFLAGLILPLAVAGFQSSPGYMDAEYYFAGGLQLATGQGFSEPFLWNYLDDPPAIPRASHTYWMPLASLLAAAGMVITGSVSLWSARVFSLLLAGLIPAATTWLAWDLSHQRSKALLAGALALLPGFYLPYLATTDTFGLYAVLGAAWFILVGRIAQTHAANRFKWAKVMALGMIAGLMHLSRADGILWLGISCLFIILDSSLSIGVRLQYLVWLGAGYLMIMGPWMVRNLAVLGSPLSAASTKMLWLVDYDDLYLYPASQLTPQRWIDSGMVGIVENRVLALISNIQSALAVQGSIFLAPLIALGVWQRREEVRVRYGLLYWVLLLSLMSVAFPFAGARGGFFHSGAAVQPLFWAVIPAGLEVFLTWGAKRRGWEYRQAEKFFRAAVLLFTLILTLYLSALRLGLGSQGAGWDAGFEHYVRLDEQLMLQGAQPGDLVLVNDPPGFFVAARRGGIAIPDGGPEELALVAARYHVRYVLLEANHPRGLNDLYLSPGDWPGLKYLQTFEDTHIFLVVP